MSPISFQPFMTSYHQHFSKQKTPPSNYFLKKNISNLIAPKEMKANRGRSPQISHLQADSFVVKFWRIF